ncbi:MAG TPA: exonuclease domain-containing protein [Saprospiraceae bacterium]|nr:exonuclease domain-containing protein [Saprospiraceae bacterium]
MAQNKRFAIIDIETTGVLSKRDKITEIGIVLFDGKNILDTYSTLIYPERSIPPEITRITGINDSMVLDAPKFYEIGKDIVEWTENCIFVGHNVRFDYSFIKEEFYRLGYTYMRKKMCTVQLARKQFPGLPSYSLGQLIERFNIEVSARHRALDDALATTELLEIILLSDSGRNHAKTLIQGGIKDSFLPAAISRQQIEELPETFGVYYFYNSFGKVIYVGKSNNIRKRVIQHFSDSTRKAENLQKMVDSMDYAETGSELVALLMESEEIKKWNPDINKAQRKKEFPYVITEYFDQEGYRCFSCSKLTAKLTGNVQILSYYSSIDSARSRMAAIAKKWDLCPVKTSLSANSERGCLSYKMDQCKGACSGNEENTTYNIRALNAREDLNYFFEEDFILELDGRNVFEKAYVLVSDGLYRGFCFIETQDFHFSGKEISDQITPGKYSIEASTILHRWLLQNPSAKKIPIYCDSQV